MSSTNRQLVTVTNNQNNTTEANDKRQQPSKPNQANQTKQTKPNQTKPNQPKTISPDCFSTQGEIAESVVGFVNTLERYINVTYVEGSLRSLDESEIIQNVRLFYVFCCPCCLAFVCVRAVHEAIVRHQHAWKGNVCDD
jgi:hypothetical protein